MSKRLFITGFIFGGLAYVSALFGRPLTYIILFDLSAYCFLAGSLCLAWSLVSADKRKKLFSNKIALILGVVFFAILFWADKTAINRFYMSDTARIPRMLIKLGMFAVLFAGFWRLLLGKKKFFAVAVIANCLFLRQRCGSGR